MSGLVRRARCGDHRAFATLVRRYRDRIFALALHITGNRSDADDVTQEVFFSAHRALPAFEERSQFFTWIYRMAVNRSLNVRRSRSRRAETAQVDDIRVELALAVDAADSPQRAAELRQVYGQLLGALDELPTETRTTVVLVILQGMSHAEAALIQGCRPGTIAWRIHVARHRLREALARWERRSSDRPSTELAELLHRWGWPALTPF